MREYIKNFIRNRLHKSAEKFWTTTDNTYLASPEYYLKQEEALHGILREISPVESAFDVGCGDGRFTRVIKQYSGSVKASDISPKLIEKARKQSPEGLINYSVGSVLSISTTDRCDLVCCMGVTSGLIEQKAFVQAVQLLCDAAKPAGYLLMKESLSVNRERFAPRNKINYVALYRNIDSYLDAFASRGCNLLKKVELAADAKSGIVNCFFLFKAP